MRKHLAIFSPRVTGEIFAGIKTIETRFSKNRIAPFGQVSIGDIVYIKPVGQEVKGQFIVQKVISFEGLDRENWDIIKKIYGQDQIYFQKHQDAKFGTLIFIARVEQFLTSPIKFDKKDKRGWVVLN